MAHANWLEIIWLMVASAGWLAAAINFWEARYDWRRFRNSQIPEQRFLTRAILYGGIVIFIKHNIALAGALWAVTHAPPPPAFLEVYHSDTQLLGTTVCWALVTCGMTVQAVLGIRWRRQLSTGDYDGTGIIPVATRRKTDDLIPKSGVAVLRPEVRHPDSIQLTARDDINKEK